VVRVRAARGNIPRGPLANFGDAGFQPGASGRCALGGHVICTGTRVVKYTAGGEPQELAQLPERVTAQVMQEDHTGALWIGTVADGLLRLKGNDLESVTVSQPEITALDGRS